MSEITGSTRRHYGVLVLVLSLGATGACEASGEVVFVLDDSSGAAVLWLLSVLEVVFTFDESLGIGATFGVEGVLGVMPCVALVEVTGAGVVSGMTTGGGVGLVLASVSELLRLQPTKAKGESRETVRLRATNAVPAFQSWRVCTRACAP